MAFAGISAREQERRLLNKPGLPAPMRADISGSHLHRPNGQIQSAPLPSQPGNLKPSASADIPRNPRDSPDYEPYQPSQPAESESEPSEAEPEPESDEEGEIEADV